MSNASLPPGDDRARNEDRGIPWRLVLWVLIALYALAFPWLILLSMALGAALAIIGPRWWRSRRRG